MVDNITTDKNFDKSLRGLIKITNTIISRYSETGLDIGGKTELIRREVSKFKEEYEMMDIQIYKEILRTIYLKYRLSINKGYRSDTWLKNKNITIRISNDYTKFRLSDIYLYAEQLKAHTIKSISKFKKTDELEDDDDDLNTHKELIYMSVFMLHLYRIFKEICDIEDKEILTSHINDLESYLNIENSSSKNTTNNGLSGIFNTVKTLFNPGEGGNDNILKGIGNAFSSMNINNNGEGSNTDDGNLDIGKIMQNFISNPQIIDKIKTSYTYLMEGFKTGEPTDIQSMVTTLANGIFNDPYFGQNPKENNNTNTSTTTTTTQNNTTNSTPVLLE